MTDLSTVLCVAAAVYLYERHRSLIRPSPPSEAVESEAVPPEIMQRAMSYPEEWARDQYLARAKELYRQHGRWDNVYVTLSNE